MESDQLGFRADGHRCRGRRTTAYDDSRSDEDMVRPTATRYAPIREAVERRVNTFLRQDLVSHLEIGFNEIFLLHYIEIAADSQGTAALAQFLHEFSPESRVHWVKKLLGPAVGQHVSVDQFLGLDKEFSAEDLAETDPFEEKLNQAATPLYRIILHGRWESRPAAADREEGLRPSSDLPGPRNHPARIRLRRRRHRALPVLACACRFRMPNRRTRARGAVRA